MILPLNEVEGYILPMVMVTLEGQNNIEARAKMLTAAMVELIKQDREAHRRVSLKI